MKPEDIKVGVFVKCIKAERLLIENIFEIIEKLPDNKWKLMTTLCARGAIKNNLKYRDIEIIVSQQTLQHNFKLDKQYAVRRPKEIKNEA